MASPMASAVHWQSKPTSYAMRKTCSSTVFLAVDLPVDLTVTSCLTTKPPFQLPLSSLPSSDLY